MVAQSSIFPIFLRSEYREDANGIPKFISRIQQAAKISEAELGRVGAALNKALAAPRTGSGSLDLGVGQLREQIKAQEQAAAAAREVQQALLAVANATGKFNGALTPTINAYRDLAKAKDADAASSRAQLSTLQAVEAELEKGTRAVQARLAAEQGLANFRKTANINDGAARIVAGQGAVDRAALSGATLDGVLGRVNRNANPEVAQQRAREAAESEKVAAAARQQAAAMAELVQAEAAAATGSKLLQAIYRGTALELNNVTSAQDRTAKSARESAAAFQQAFDAQEKAAKDAAAAVREQAEALAALRAAINPAAASQQEFNQKVAFAQAALDRGELSQQEYARAVQLAASALRQAGQAEVAAAAARNGFTVATKAGTTARGNVINSIRAERTAFTQLGQQLTDVGIQYQLGTSALTIMTQQLPQAAFALSGLSDSANKTKAAIGGVAAFIAGPYGGAIVLATALLGPFIVKMIEAGTAAESTARSVEELVAEKVKAAAEARNGALAEDAFRLSLDGVTESIRKNREALQELNAVKRTAAELALQNSQRIFAEATILQFNTQQQLINAQALLQAQIARASGPGEGNERAALGLEARADRVQQLLENFVSGSQALVEAQQAIRKAQVGVAIDEGLAGEEGRIKRRYAELIDNLREEASARGLNRDQIRAEAAALKAREDAEIGALRKTGRDGSAAAKRREIREQEQLAKFGESAAEQIQRINERFDEQPRLIDQASQATRQLDELIADLEKRKPANFEKLIEDAERAKGVIDDALVRPFEQLRQESENRVAIERALAAGREDEAAALQEIFRLEQQRGPLTKQEKEDVEDIVRLERERITYLRDQQALFQAQLDVVQTVRRDLTDLLSGRSNDFFKNFRQALQDLQGQRLFEDLFGQAFRDIEEQLRGNTPQGRANAAYTAEVNKTAETTGRLETSLDGLTSAVDGARDKLLGDFDGTFGGAANDNTISSSAGALASIAAFVAQQSGIGTGITVAGNRNRLNETKIARASTKDIADQISKATVTGFLEPLRDVLGDKFFNGLAGVLGNVLSAYVRGGEAGAVFEGLSQAANAFGAEGLGAAFSQASAGAAVGTQVAGISRALGLGGSTTGAQIGGALGSFAGPIGTVVGAIAGNIIGGLLKATKRGSATIGNVAGELGIVSTRGNSRSRIEQSTGLAGSALDAIENIAAQLGANVDAARGSVSIGVRDDNIRVDTSGRGITRTRNGAIDFGDDAEAAVRAAVLDLIQDGVITGLRAAESRLLEAGDDIEEALRDVLTFRSVFDRLQEIKDPLGFAITSLNREFEGLIDLFERAGASTEEFASLEELYNLERARAIQDATDRVAGSLKQLLADLTIGDSGLSLRDRRSNALGQFNSLAARVASGDSSAFDDFADVSQQLLDIERQLFGSTQSYFDRLAEITRLTEAAIADQTNVVSIGSGAPSPFAERDAVVSSIDVQTTEVTGWLRTINDTLITLNSGAGFAPIAVNSGGRSSLPFPTSVANF